MTRTITLLLAAALALVPIQTTNARTLWTFTPKEKAFVICIIGHAGAELIANNLADDPEERTKNVEENARRSCDNIKIKNERLNDSLHRMILKMVD